MNDLIVNAFDYFGDIEEALDKQISPEQAKDNFNAPDDREYHVILTAKEWRTFGKGMVLLQTATRAERSSDRDHRSFQEAVMPAPDDTAARDWRASRCGHNFEIPDCRYESCASRSLNEAVVALLDWMERVTTEGCPASVAAAAADKAHAALALARGDSQ